MPRYLVQRRLAGAPEIGADDGQPASPAETGAYAGLGVTWLQSYVSADKTTAFGIYDGPSEEAIEQAAQVTGRPADSVNEIRLPVR
jgi:Protein of unknown function (DUF4242)